MPTPHDADVVNTYRYLRLATIPLLLMLLVSVAIEALRLDPDCLLGSISAYYYTPARGIFVGALCAVGVCLIVYKGNDPLEDVLLNFSGFMAFVVGLVPPVPDGLCGSPLPQQVDTFVADAVRNNGWTLLVAAVLGLVMRWVLVRLDRTNTEGPPFEVLPADTGLRRWTRIATWLCWAVLVAELVLFLALPEVFLGISHGVAAVTMVLGVIGVMVANARGLAIAVKGPPTPGARDPRRWANRYGIVAVVLAVLLLATVAAHLLVHDNKRIVLVLEVIVILTFLVFWGMQTAELWNRPSREDRPGHTSGAARDDESAAPFRQR
jgi:hypothetical protein